MHISRRCFDASSEGTNGSDICLGNFGILNHGWSQSSKTFFYHHIHQLLSQLHNFFGFQYHIVSLTLNQSPCYEHFSFMCKYVFTVGTHSLRCVAEYKCYEFH